MKVIFVVGSRTDVLVEWGKAIVTKTGDIPILSSAVDHFFADDRRRHNALRTLLHMADAVLLVEGWEQSFITPEVRRVADKDYRPFFDSTVLSGWERYVAWSEDNRVPDVEKQWLLPTP